MKILGRTSRFVQYRSGRKAWYCKILCDKCGKPFEALEKNIKSGNTRSCGCGIKGFAGQSLLAEYRIWQGIKQRCLNPKCSAFHKYGAKGITIHPDWKESFELFYHDMGPRPTPSHSIDRYPDREGNYEPGNCRWATAKEQRANQRPRRYSTS